jgi:UDP-2,4-diacetamido-2,4,6-trideoxy-beta-L-altropyranose hydrolase
VAGLTLRPAANVDCELLWKWRNEPGVRAASFTSDPIEWEVHRSWFDGRMADPGCTIWIACDESGEGVGQVRFDVIKDGEFEIAVSIDEGHRSSGYGARLIRLATDDFLSVGEPRTIHAYIKHDNTASIRAFSKAGYQYVGVDEIRGVRCEHLARSNHENS